MTHVKSDLFISIPEISLLTLSRGYKRHWSVYVRSLAHIISKLRWRLSEHHHHTKDPHYQSYRKGYLS